MSIQILYLFFNQIRFVLFCFDYWGDCLLYKFWILTPWIYENIFSHFWKHFLPFSRWPFHFVDGLLCCAEIFLFDVIHLFIFAFVAFEFEVRSKKIITEGFLPMHSSRCFMVLGLTFVFNPFSVNFCVWRKIVVSFILYVSAQFSQHHFLKKLSFLIVYSWFLYCNLIDHTWLVYFWALYSVPPTYVSFMLTPYCFNYYSFVIQFEIRKYGTSSFVLPSQDCFSYSRSFMIPYKF